MNINARVMWIGTTVVADVEIWGSKVIEFPVKTTPLQVLEGSKVGLYSDYILLPITGDITRYKGADSIKFPSAQNAWDYAEKLVRTFKFLAGRGLSITCKHCGMAGVPRYETLDWFVQCQNVNCDHEGNKEKTEELAWLSWNGINQHISRRGDWVNIFNQTERVSNDKD